MQKGRFLFVFFSYFLCRNLVERRLAYGKALQYQSRQTEETEEKVTELDMNISHSGGENETKATLGKEKKDFKMPESLEQESKGGKTKRSKHKRKRGW